MTDPRAKNIVFILADQLGANALGCYGSGVDSTPALDALARSGMRFNRHYCTHPSCSPSRASYLTGRSAAVHGVVDNNYVLSSDLPTYAMVLAAYGYSTGAFGKLHQTPMTLDLPRDFSHLGFHESVVTEDPKWGPWIEWIRTEHPDRYAQALSMCWDPSLRSLDRKTIRERESARNEHLLPRQQSSRWRSMYESPLSPDLHDSAFITDRAIDFIDGHLSVETDRPFLCHVSYVDPHDPYDSPAPYSTMYRAADMRDPLPAEWQDDGITALNDRSYIGFDQICDDPDTIREWRAMFHGELRFLDDQIGRLLTLLNERELWDDTVVVFATDHGEMLGDHGLVAKHLPQYDAGIRCPLIVAGGGITAGESDELVGTLDFFPSLCAWGGVPEHLLPPHEGTSFADICGGASHRRPRREINVSGTGVETVISDDGWRLTRYHQTGEGQLFDLRNDPDEQHNLYGDPEYGEKRVDLLERLVTSMARPRNTPDFRALPLLNGRRAHGATRLSTSIPDYPGAARKPEW